MATIGFTSLLISSLCFIVLLTSSVRAEPDGTSSTLPSPSRDSPSKSATIGEHSRDDVSDDKKIPENPTSMITEGGPVPIPSNIQQQANIKAINEPHIPDESKTRENTPKERNAASSVVPRKGVEKQKKIKGRKGVNQSSLDPEQTTTSISQTTLDDAKPILENTAAPSVHADDQPKASNVDDPKLHATVAGPNINSDHGASSSSTLTSVNATTSRTESTNGTMVQKSSSSVEKKHKPKPTVTTVGESNVDEGRVSLRSKNPPLGMPRKIDYIVPVIITIIAVPLLGTAIFVLYRRGRDCWDKRHYRRMDFLIDGMYND